MIQLKTFNFSTINNYWYGIMDDIEFNKCTILISAANSKVVYVNFKSYQNVQ